jgi:hypothetical protein
MIDDIEPSFPLFPVTNLPLRPPKHSVEEAMLEELGLGPERLARRSI